LLRDAGSPTDTRSFDDRDDLPRIIRAGRHLARPKRYQRGFALELEDGTVLDPDGSAAEPDERFSDDELMVGAGDCERGPVVFAVPQGVRPTTFLLVTTYGNVEWPLDG
jgi:hypothetical protein